MIELKDAHKGETAWIIGKGNSLLKIQRKHIGEGPVIAIYEAIVPIEMMGIHNELYCLEKDGGQLKRNPLTDDPECDRRAECEFCQGMVVPRKAHVLLHDKEARHCLENYPRRHIFTLDEIGLPKNEFSLVCAVKIAEYMGCDKIRFVSCDAHATGNNENCLPMFHQEYYDWIYGMQKKILPHYLEGKDYQWVTPS